jgi:hypothetical protein
VFAAVAVWLDVVDPPTSTFSWLPDLRRRDSHRWFARSKPATP